MPLTAREVQAAKPKDKPYGLADGGGLSLWVTPVGQRYWHFRYRIDGKQPRISLGVYPTISLQLAREKAAEMRALVARGIDPSQKRKVDKQASTESKTNLFRVAAEDWYQSKVKAGRSASTLDKMRTYLDKDILPVLGDKHLPSVSRADCASVQTRIEKRGALNVSKKVRGWLREIFSRAIAKGLCDNNPASELRYIAKEAPRAEHYPHLLEPELPDFLRKLDNSTSRLINRTAAWMAILTASRPGMVRFAQWHEVDLDDAIWRIDAEKMKMRRMHVTPLPTQLVAMLKELREITGRQQYLFPGIGTKNAMISENTVNKVFRLIGYKGRMVSHGTRHTASTLLREHGWPKQFVDAQLSHKETGIAGDYNHAIYLPQRRLMMQWYADYLDALRVGLTSKQSQAFARRVNTNARLETASAES
ncbi:MULTISPECIES: tyrosine-type recombinase/integrase [Spongiibacter]|jgi:integrase|uniref:tyrosine-type recombinase/integrase n=1 Tax=Spongiibacter TaxID=630749 RepID=UPI00062DD0BD|nr:MULTISPECIES: integrase arm-type DNA-binding domain-containing protein [Spongiibacter]AKH70525.1 Integrase [Spongiibacter sp. IMCC21906]MAY39462.1 integrase [Spongiibacter sp.]MBI57332.1 integrase [Spongiibacter sp.]|tara:strand:- start:2406 stop:3665 length:1260 start_codon:yes stop_codon:yes gene_type:complete